MDSSNLSGANLAKHYSMMDARQSLASTYSAPNQCLQQHHQETVGIAALTPPSMTDSPPVQSPLELVSNYPARLPGHFQPTPPPETAEAAQHNFAPLDGSRDFDYNVSGQLRQPAHYGPPPTSRGHQYPQASLSTPNIHTKPAALAATHPTHYQAPQMRAPSYHRNPLSPSPRPADAHSARTMMPPPPRTSPSRHHTASASNPPNAPESHKTEWSNNTDPSLRTHYGLPKWPRPLGMAPTECDLTHGNAASPTFMIGLPFGSTIELANYYR